MIGMVEDACLVNGVVGLVDNGVNEAVEEIFGRRFRRDIFSHIEHSRDRQATRLYESLCMILNNIVHPPRTIIDIEKDYREAQRSL